MNRLHLAPFLACSFLFAAGCAEGTIEDLEEADDIAEAVNPLTADNAMTPNAMTPNAMTPNAMTPNAMTPNAMTPNAMAASAMAAIQSDSSDGQLSRQLLKYTVSCALTPSQSFAFSWTDSTGTVHNEVYEGLLGIAPNWQTGPLTNVTQQRLMSACLAARTNWYGVTVMISLRSKLDPLRTHVQSPELDAYPNVEGAFFGNLFTETPAVYTCYYDPNVALARSQQRDCSAGHLDANGQPVQCGAITILGSCEDWCHNLDNHERWYNSCDIPNGSGTTSSSAAVVVALPPNDP